MKPSRRYFAILDNEATLADPAGLVRRQQYPDGGFIDEGLHRDMTWKRTPLIVEWERAEATDDLVEVSEAEAERIIERLRERWSARG